MESKFNFFIEADSNDALEKAKKFEKGDNKRYSNMVFSGIASDDSCDADGESMTPTGFDISYFKKNGYFNLDHLPTRAKDKKSSYWVGEPLDAKVEKNKLWVKGRLWEKSPEARAFWDKCIEMKESGSSRKPGMSIEGRVIERDKKNPKKITKAQITNIALTMNPVNGNSYVDILKGKQSSDFVDYEFEGALNNNSEEILVEYIDKNGDKVTVDKDFKIKIVKKDTSLSDVISKKFEKGEISEDIYKDFLKKVK